VESPHFVRREWRTRLSECVTGPGESRPRRRSLPTKLFLSLLDMNSGERLQVLCPPEELHRPARPDAYSPARPCTNSSPVAVATASSWSCRPGLIPQCKKRWRTNSGCRSGLENAAALSGADRTLRGDQALDVPGTGHHTSVEYPAEKETLQQAVRRPWDIIVVMRHTISPIRHSAQPVPTARARWVWPSARLLQPGPAHSTPHERLRPQFPVLLELIEPTDATFTA